MSWCGRLVFVLILNGVYSQLYEGKYEGDECELENDETGICVRLSQCASAIELVYKRQHPVTCSFIRFTPIVCCPNKEIIKTRLSEQKCIFYKTIDLRTTEPSSTTPFDKTKLIIKEIFINPDIPKAPLTADLYPDNAEKNFTSNDFDYTDTTVVKRPDILEEVVENNKTEDLDGEDVLNKTKNNIEEIGTVFIRFNYTEDTSKEIQDPLVILTNISKPADFTPLNSSNVEIKFNQNFTADNENDPIPLSIIDIPETADPDIRELFNLTEINIQNVNSSQENTSSTTDSSVSITTDYDYSDFNINDTFIIRGSIATDGEFPHMAALGYSRGEEILWRCGGSLVSDKFVLTAAHCLYHSEFGQVEYVSLGSININLRSGSEPYSTQQIYKVDRRIRHPLYKRPSTYHDIALLELERPVEFTELVRPACLHTREIEDKVQLVATGWGLTEHGGNGSDYLQKVNLDVFTTEECFKTYEDLIHSRRLRSGIIDQEQFCAGGKQGEEDTCNGDSGGPLQFKLDDNTGPIYTIIGITSFGKSCGLYGVPGVYIRVAKYIPWLETIIWPNEF